MLKIQTGLLKNKTNWNEVVKAGKLTKKINIVEWVLVFVGFM